MRPPLLNFESRNLRVRVCKEPEIPLNPKPYTLNPAFGS